MKKPKVSAICCTYKRFECVERVLNCYLAQDYTNKELIIYNTDVESPYEADLKSYGVTIINCDTDLESNENGQSTPYTSVGAIRRDALKFAKGDYVVTWDDDDIFLPWFMRQAIDRINDTGLPSFKPEQSFFYSGHLRLVRNTLEASVVADIKKVREYGYLLETGKEGLGWYTKLRDNRELNEHDTHYLPAYCFNWNDGSEMKAPHKQSGDIDNPDNFENHKANSIDPVNGRILSVWSKEKMERVYQPYNDFILNTIKDYPPEVVDRYF